jgi:hypothetical protein
MFAPVMYRETKKPRFPAALGIYFCSHKDFTRFSRLSFAADGRHLSYTRGNEKHDTLEFMFLLTLLDESIHPAVWRLFPRTGIPVNFHSGEYEAARRHVCRLLLHFRSKEMAKKFYVDSPNDRLMICDDSATRLAIGDSRDEDNEIENVIREDAQAGSEF